MTKAKNDNLSNRKYILAKLFNNKEELGRTGALSAIAIISIIFLLLILIVVIVFIERAQRRLLVQYPKRQVGNKVFGGQSSYLPIKINIAGVIFPFLN